MRADKGGNRTPCAAPARGRHGVRADVREAGSGELPLHSDVSRAYKGIFVVSMNMEEWVAIPNPVDI